ncbi:MAG: histidine phosphatase family protein [Candidatus Aenigmarchaeota archaeon]|nr:histidine phosphatase family protein [Candidatus Aenigmarchaeota archaeon]MDI6722698.1 histidine phosphatase family protein [Candidatus Aenigmarchaeota archaeon]
MKIFLIRHGETEENAKQIVQGQASGKLSEKGKEQAKKVARRLSKEKIDAIFSSPLERADLTAREVSRQHSLKIIYDDRLKERDHGNFEGMKRGEYFEETRKSGVPWHKFRPKGGESYLDVKKRAEAFYKMLLEEYAGKTVVIVTHGTFNRVFLSVVGHASIEKAHELEQKNTCVNVIEIVRGKPVIKLVNCTKHLE